MRVVCHSLKELLVNLRTVTPESVFQRTVYASVTHRPIDNANKHKALKLAVVFQVSTVIETDNGGEYILESGEECGFDYVDASNEAEGTVRAESLMKVLVEHCGDIGLKVRPGVIEN